ncbi:hypothetical protein [Legionella spiritensis]|uniref:Uncharacterized protein n=1 Tax=Legionella spiritensis TaxID=452 RepID=A0A0W0Z585_LEGSP|nr:hypothetical protein [Legionella spiritensis]KTD64313.1 hypothetical protein Lspi_1120 [Legionella spiritensis]SNV46682.1 Uncharacterised protein [Legionella spiritensis]VEG91122.1 Uncharacterised protein [Legionella spiritensis]
MNRMIASLLVTLFFLPVQAADITTGEIKAQESDEERCYQERVGRCIDKCDHAEDKNCTLLCEATVRNECRQAGE